MSATSECLLTLFVAGYLDYVYVTPSTSTMVPLRENLRLQPVEIDIHEIIAILRRQKRLILMTVALVIGLAFAYLLTAEPKYDATALIQVSTGNSNLLDPNAVNGMQSTTLSTNVDGEVEILKSPATAVAVIAAAGLVNDGDFGPRIGMREKIGLALGIDLSSNRLRAAFGLEPRPGVTGEALVGSVLAKFQSNLNVRRRGLTYLIAVSVTSVDARRAADLANITAKVYIERQVAAKIQGSIAARDVLSRQLATAQAGLAASEDSLNGFIKTNLARLESESGSADVAALRREMEAASASQAALLATVDAAQGALKSQDWDRVSMTLGDAALAALVAQRKDLQDRLQVVVAESLDAVDLRAALADIDASLNNKSQSVLGGLRNEVSLLGDKQTAARDALRETLLKSDLSPTMLADLFDLQQSASVARNQYQQLLARVQDFGALANIQIADARIVSEALPPTSASSPKWKLVLAAAGFLGLAAGVALAFLNEYYIGGVTSASQLRNVLQAKVPVTVPNLAASKEKSVFSDAIITAPLSPYAETFRKLRSATDIALRDLEKKRDPASGGRIVLICSALPAEGKSSTALSLARTYAAAGLETLLIDCDLRKPTLHTYLGASSDIGMLELLRGEVGNLSETIKPVFDPISPLQVMTTGGRSTEPTDQLLNSRQFGLLLMAAQNGFDIIILDSPPLLPVVDARYLAQYADVVVQVVRFASTTQGEVREAAQQLRETMAPDVELIGVLSHARSAPGKLGYYSTKYGGYYGEET